MSAENNKALVRRYVEEVLNRKNLAVVDELFAPTFVDHDSSMPEAKVPAGDPEAAVLANLGALLPDCDRSCTYKRDLQLALTR